MTPTIEDVARRTEVSKNMVSLVLNDKPSVSLTLKDVVLQAVADLGYRLLKHLPQRRSTTHCTRAVVHIQLPLLAG